MESPRQNRRSFSVHAARHCDPWQHRIGNCAKAITLRNEQISYMVEAAHPSGFVRAEGDGTWAGDGWFTQSYVVRHVFQWMLIAAAAVSVVLLVHIVMTPAAPLSETSSVGYYDDYAKSLADSYETVVFQDAHPEMARYFGTAHSKRVIDIGAGSGRDAAWLTSKGHRVTAVEPSRNMLAVGRRLHSDADVVWLSDSLPNWPTYPLAASTLLSLVRFGCTWGKESGLKVCVG